MKLFTKFFAVVLLTGYLTVPAYAAQSACTSLLPCTDKTITECQEVIDTFRAGDGKIPSAGDAEKAHAVEDTYKQYQTIFENQKKYEQAENNTKAEKTALDECKKQYGAGNLNCSSFEKTYLDAEIAKTVAEKDKPSDEEVKAAQKALDAAENDAFMNYDQATSTISQREDLLGCAIKTGRISLALIPYMITYIINFILGLAGLICVMFIVIGGYRYVFAGLTDDKDKGKKTIKDALLGMILSLLAWSIVNILLKALTS